MKKYKKTPLTIEEHIQLAADLRKAQEILEPWMYRFHDAYRVDSKERELLRKCLNLLSSKICCIQDDHWYRIRTCKEHSPYYASGKVAW